MKTYILRDAKAVELENPPLLAAGARSFLLTTASLHDDLAHLRRLGTRKGVTH